MTDRPTDLSSLPSYRAPRRSLFSARKFALMASVVAGLGVAVYGFSPSPGPVNIFSSPAHAQVNNEVRKVEKPIGFADIVERVKPSVISVKVNINEKVSKDDSAGKDDDSPFQPGSPMERFFRRFGGPDGLPPGLRGGPRGGRGPVSGQGSGFFISPDGFAVTNNHVVDGADKVEVTTDDGKTYTAKVIGTDLRTDLALIKVEGRTVFPFAKLSDG
jgi:serine protease Do